MSENNCPSYIANAKPNAQQNRAPWFKNTAPAYAGILLWFVFWTMVSSNNLVNGLFVPIAAVITGALVCHFFFYLSAGMFGMKTGLPLAVIGSSIFGEKGGIVMPGLLMGILQFGWVAVNCIGASAIAPNDYKIPFIVVWGGLATFIGLKGIKYVAGISTYLPLVPLAILLILLVKAVPSVADFNPAILKASLVNAAPSCDNSTIFMAIVGAFVAFFATAGAAGVDFGTGSRNAKDVQMGGLVGVAGMMIFTAVAALVIIAGALGNPEVAAKVIADKGGTAGITATDVMGAFFGKNVGEYMFLALALAAFPSACFSSLIAANSFKTMLPNINSTISVAIGGLAAILLAVFLREQPGAIVDVLNIIGVSFGPICGAIFIEYFLCKGKWGGPRKGFNLAGWLAWAIGFAVGILPNLGVCELPMPPVITFAIGAVVYLVAMLAGLKSQNAK
ncbi:MAG: hypothetical protein SPI34_05155 [Opitutales bacterium]|nr:hypothetical protein [Opitutales bacterium]